MLVKESSDLTLQLSCVIQLTHGTRMFKKFALDFCGKIVPLHDDCGACDSGTALTAIETPPHPIYFVPYARSPASPRPGTMNARSSRDSSIAAVQIGTSGWAPRIRSMP